MNQPYFRFSIAVLIILFSSRIFACEPASLNWELFHKRYDLNHDNQFNLKEFQQVTDFNPYLWPQDSRFQKNSQENSKQTKLFKFLDKNNDGQLNDEELGDVHQLFENPCAGWPWN